MSTQVTYVKNKDAEYGDVPHEVSGMLLYTKPMSRYSQIMSII